MRRAIAALGAALVLTLGLMVPGSPAQADSSPYTGCNFLGNHTTFFSYNGPDGAVYADTWRHYWDDGQNSTCKDINVKSTTGAAIVRVQFCPEVGYQPPHTGPGGQPAPSFNCYSMGWGSLNSLTQPIGCYCGTSAHDYHFPSTTNWHWFYRVETLNSSESYNLFT